MTTAHHAVDAVHISRWENEGGASAPAEMPAAGHFHRGMDGGTH
jgi:hypothetical protein